MKNEFEAFARFERLLGRFLLAGLATASIVLSIGLVLLIASPGGDAAGMFLTTGLLFLMATPMLRIVVSLVEYVRMREWFFVLTTSVVFLELAAGVLFALKRS